MIRQFFTFLAAAVTLSAPLTSTAQTSAQSKNNSWRNTEDPWAHKNSVTILGSVQGWGKYHSWGFGHVGLEYDRLLYRGLSVGIIGLYAPMNGNGISDGYAQEEVFTFTGAKINYNIPVMRNRLYFRVGIGGGIGWHKITDHETGELATTPAPALDTYIEPHLMVDAYWVFRATRWLDLKFSPLIVSPSQLIVGSKFNAPYNDSTFRYFNMGTIGAAVRF